MGSGIIGVISLIAKLILVCALERRGDLLFLPIWHMEIVPWVPSKLARLLVSKSIALLTIVFDVELMEIVGVPLLQKQDKEEL